MNLNFSFRGRNTNAESREKVGFLEQADPDAVRTEAVMAAPRSTRPRNWLQVKKPVLFQILSAIYCL